MRGGFAALLAAILLVSCGLETVEYLAPPGTSPSSLVDAYLQQNQYSVLTLNHDPATYSGTRFQGYEIYYRIYPQISGQPFGNITQDKASLDTSPTRDRLLSLGYQRLNGISTNSTAEPLVDLSTSGTTSVNLKFDTFFASYPGTIVEPSVTIGGSLQTEVFRTVSVLGVFNYPSFGALYGVSPTGSDIAGAATLTPTTFEIDVFLVAYSFTPEKTIYSQPVAWGILKP